MNHNHSGQESLLLEYRLDSLINREIQGWLVFVSSAAKPVKLSLSQWTLVDSRGVHHPLQSHYYQDQEPPVTYLFSRTDPNTSLKIDERRLRLLLWTREHVVQYRFVDNWA